MSLNTLEKADIMRIVSDIAERLAKIERMLQGQPIGTVRIDDASVTNAKIVSLAADKITAGDLIVAVDVGDPATGYTRLDGDNNRIVVHDGTNPRVVIGEA